MTNIEHYFENLLFDGKDVAGDLNKNELTKKEQNAIEECATYVLCTLFPGRKNIKEVLEHLKVLEIMRKFFNECQPYIEYWYWRQSYKLVINGEIKISTEEKDKLEKWLEEQEWQQKN